MPVIGNSTYTERPILNCPCVVNSYFKKKSFYLLFRLIDILQNKKMWVFLIASHCHLISLTD